MAFCQMSVRLSIRLSIRLSSLHCVSKKFTILRILGQMLNYFNFGSVAAEKICNQKTYSFLIISSVCTNIT